MWMNRTHTSEHTLWESELFCSAGCRHTSDDEYERRHRGVRWHMGMTGWDAQLIDVLYQQHADWLGKLYAELMLS